MQGIESPIALGPVNQMLATTLSYVWPTSLALTGLMWLIATYRRDEKTLTNVRIGGTLITATWTLSSGIIEASLTADFWAVPGSLMGGVILLGLLFFVDACVQYVIAAGTEPRPKRTSIMIWVWVWVTIFGLFGKQLLLYVQLRELSPESVLAAGMTALAIIVIALIWRKR